MPSHDEGQKSDSKHTTLLVDSIDPESGMGRRGTRIGIAVSRVGVFHPADCVPKVESYVAISVGIPSMDGTKTTPLNATRGGSQHWEGGENPKPRAATPIDPTAVAVTHDVDARCKKNEAAVSRFVSLRRTRSRVGGDGIVSFWVRLVDARVGQIVARPAQPHLLLAPNGPWAPGASR